MYLSFLHHLFLSIILKPVLLSCKSDDDDDDDDDDGGDGDE